MHLFGLYNLNYFTGGLLYSYGASVLDGLSTVASDLGTEGTIAMHWGDPNPAIRILLETK